MKPTLRTLLAMVISIAGLPYATIGNPCINFVSPVTGNLIKTQLCTLLIEETECPSKIKKVEFQARYFPFQSDTPAIARIGSIQKPPFAIEWDISKIPNQLFSGAAIFAEATLSNGDLEAVRQEGIFLTHQPVERMTHAVQFGFSGADRVEPDPIEITPWRKDILIRASTYWNPKELIFIVQLSDSLFSPRLPPREAAAIGIELLLDPTCSRTPFPGKEVFIYSVPFSGMPYRVMYKLVPDDNGSYRFETSTSPSDFKVKVKKGESRGYTVICAVPFSSFGVKRTDTIGCNIVVKGLSRNDRAVQRSSWINAGKYETYSPFLWGELQLRERPFIMNRLLVGGTLFGIGFLITLAISALLMFRPKPKLSQLNVQTDAERQQFATIRERIDSSITSSDINIDAVAKALGSSANKVSLLIRRATGMNFQTYVMFSRTEIAKERLRSSHCTMENVATECGFGSVGELERYFMKFTHTTPAKFREEQQIT